MLKDTSEIQSGQVIPADICVIGSGPAAFALALEFIDGAPTHRPLKVVMLESQMQKPSIERAFAAAAGLDTACDVQGLFYPGVLAGLLPVRANNYLCCGPWAGRLREFGGTANHWGGWDWPLEPWDLGGRPFHRGAAWPAGFDQILDRYYRRVTAAVMQLNAFEFDNPQFWIDSYPQFDLEQMCLPPGSPLRTRILQFNPIHFGNAYGPKVNASPYVDIFFNANALTLEMAPEGASRRATRLKVGSLTASCTPGNEWYVEAQNYVICTGGIESTRFLLLNDIGNQGGELGRTFMDNPYMAPGASFSLTSKLPRGVQDFYFSPRSLPGGPPYFSTFIAGLVPTEAYLKTHPDRGDFRILVGSQGSSVGLYVNTEPQPDPNSRITLADPAEMKPDVFGQRRVRVDWETLSANGVNADTETLRATFDTARQVLQDELGYIEDFTVAEQDYQTKGWPEWRNAGGGLLVHPGLHPQGSTRISSDPATGVVDPNLRVHDTTNVFVSASSNFPTAGYQNPTFAVCALSVRLADHFIDAAKP